MADPSQFQVDEGFLQILAEKGESVKCTCASRERKGRIKGERGRQGDRGWVEKGNGGDGIWCVCACACVCVCVRVYLKRIVQ